MTPAELINRLNQIPPLELEIIPVIIELRDPSTTPARHASLQNSVDKGIAELEQHYKSITKVVERCLKIKPKPADQLPIGF